MPTALLSVSDKTGLVQLATALHELGWTMIASGGTAAAIAQAALPVTPISDYTGSPEVLDGRVKTLHPAVHAGILSRGTHQDDAELAALGWGQIDLVVANLYPFEQTVARPDVSREEAVEQIDIGGVALIRAAAKNHARVTLLCDPTDYLRVVQSLRSGVVPPELRAQLAVKGFELTARYDASIADYFSGSQTFQVRGFPIQPLRYGENPHQPAQVFAYQPGQGPLGGRVRQGKELSYNNLLDLDSAWRAARAFDRPTACIVKHLSPCGIASAADLPAAYQAAFASDPVSAFGGVVAINQVLDEDTAVLMKDLFIECIAAPGFTESALEVLSSKKNLRLMDMSGAGIGEAFELRSISAGFLKQAVDSGDPPGSRYRVVTTREPDADEWLSLHFAWKACQHVRSNAILLAQGEASVGIGGGQPNRVDSVRIAIQRAGGRAHGSVMASDAFFPFPDSIEIAASAGIRAVIQPGGSVRDQEVIAAADQAGMAMVFTGVRHFRH